MTPPRAVKVIVLREPPLQRRFTVAWASWAAAFFLFEAWAIRNKTVGDTLTEHVRHYFQIKGKVGTFVFLGMFGTFSAWFVAHILKPVAQRHNL